MMGALPEYDGGYRDTANGSEGRMTRYSATNATSNFDTSGGNSLYSPAPTGDFAPPPADAENKPEESPVDTTSPVDVTKYKSDVTAETDQPNNGGGNGGGSGTGDEDGTKSNMTPILLIGGAALLYFLFLRKKS